MTTKTLRRLFRFGLPSGVVSALATGAQGVGAAASCALWAGVALPGLQLLRGAAGTGDGNIAVSLQSALLGIDDSGKPTSAQVQAAAHELGFFPVKINANSIPHSPIVRSPVVPPLHIHTSAPSAPAEIPASSWAATTPEPSAPSEAPAPQSPTPEAPALQPELPLAPEPLPVEPSLKPAPDPAISIPIVPTPGGLTPLLPTPAPAPDTPLTPASPPQPQAQTITFTSTAPTAATVGGAQYDVLAGASSGLAVALAIEPASAAVCSLSGATVRFIGVGTCTIDADPAPQAHQSFSVGTGFQTISFTTTAPSGAVYHGSTYGVAASADSGLAVTLSIDATSSAVCSLTGSTVSFTAPGTCTVDADQTGNADYNAAPQAQQTFTVGKATQTISFTSSAPSSATFGDPGYSVSAIADSGLPVTLSVDPASAAVCSLSGGTVSYTSGGTCTVDADQAGNANYHAASEAQQSFTVAKASQTISFTSSAPSSAVFGGAGYTVSATAGSGLPVTLSIDSVTAGVCTISGSTVTYTSAGTCTVDANQAGDADYAPASQAHQTFTIGRGSQTISFTSSAPSNAAYGGPGYTVSATSDSGLPVALSVDGSSAAVCSLSGSAVSFQGVGTCTVDADQAGDADYNAAAQAQQSFNVGKASQTIGFTSSAPSNAANGGPAYTVSATSDSGLPVNFSIAAASAGVCSLSGSTVSFTGAGTCSVDADQPGNGSYSAAPQAHQSFAVGTGSQTISFTSSAPSSAVYHGPTYTVAASSDSGLAVTLSIDATSSGVCAISGSTVSFIGAGTCLIDADQAGNANYDPAPEAHQSFAVGKASQTVSFTTTAPAGATVGGATYTVGASADSGLVVAYSIDPVSTAVCSVSGSTVSFTAVGSCTVDADQGGNANYTAAAQTQQTFTVAKGSQTISFTSSAPSGAVYQGPTYTVTASSDSGLATTLSIDATSSAVCSLSGSTVSFTAVGTCTVDADQAGNANYNAAAQAHQTFAVGKAPQTIGFTSTAPGGVTVGGPGYNVSASASSGLTVAFAIDPASTAVCSLTGSTISFTAVGPAPSTPTRPATPTTRQPRRRRRASPSERARRRSPSPRAHPRGPSTRDRPTP